MARRVGQNRHGTWPARWRTADGRQLSRSFPTKVERDDFLRDLRDGFNPDAGRELFGPFAERWAEAQDWEDTSRQSWDEVFKRLDRHLGR